MGPPNGLAVELLHTPVAGDDRPGRRWAHSPRGRLLVSVFVAFHAAALLLYNMPVGGLTGDFRAHLLDLFQARRYIRMASLSQDWGMFAPSPARHNAFLRVLVEDRDGVVWDTRNDIYGRRSYPYWVYSVKGRINQRLFDQAARRAGYAAWVCREWERDHGGEPAEEVRLVKMWTRIPPPGQAPHDPLELPLRQAVILTVPCRTAVHAQLPPYLRERYGLDPAPEGTFRPLETFNWVDVERLREKLGGAEALEEARRSRSRPTEQPPEEADP